MKVDKTEQDSAFGIVRQESLVEQVRDRILGAIVKGELQPGERLSEADLARRMGVSRGPVREAARLLEQRGFLRSEPRRGFFVRALTIKDIENLREMRTCLSIYAARKAKENATADDIRILKELFEKVREASASDDHLAPLEATYALHRFIFYLTDNPRFMEFLEDIIWEGRQIATLVNLADQHPGDFFIETLEPFVDAFENGTPDQAAEKMGEYLRINHEGVLEFFRQRMTEESPSHL